MSIDVELLDENALHAHAEGIMRIEVEDIGVGFSSDFVKGLGG